MSVDSCNLRGARPKQPNLTEALNYHQFQAKKAPMVKLIPDSGYRFKIRGDFNGDGKKEILQERFIRSIDHQETNKFYRNVDYNTLVALNYRNKPISFLTCTDKHIRNLPIAPDANSFGLAYLKNEGDLDEDGGDEIAYVVNYADWSNVNFCHIMTYKNYQWKTLYSFEIRDWQLPDLPQTYSQSGMTGRENIIAVNDSAANQKIARAFNDFKGLIKKVAKYKIQINYCSDEGTIDTTIVDIRKHREKTLN
jgi:hypothetical protein